MRGEAGTLNRGLQYGTTASLLNASVGVQMLASNALKCYGVCLAGENVFYTDESAKLRPGGGATSLAAPRYGVNRAATSRHVVTTVSSELKAPRGCVHDGAGTVYAAAA